MANFNPYGYGYGYNNNFPYFNGNNNQPNYGNNFTQPQPQQPQLNNYAFVNGIEGAKAYQVLPNQTMLLMDSDNPIAYMKSANAMGQSTLRYFKLVEIKEADLKGLNQAVAPQNIDTSKFISREEFDAKINELMTKLNGGDKDAKSV